MTCGCIETVNAELATRNTQLNPTIIFSEPAYMTVTIETVLREKKRGARPVAMLPTYCPFCGTRYEE